MIKTFATKTAEHLFHGIDSKHARKLHSTPHPKAQRLLDQLNAITRLDTLRVPPSNHLEKLSGDYKYFWSIRINQQWRVVFQWIEGDVYEVDIVDYH